MLDAFQPHPDPWLRNEKSKQCRPKILQATFLIHLSRLVPDRCAQISVAIPRVAQLYLRLPIDTKFLVSAFFLQDPARVLDLTHQDQLARRLRPSSTEFPTQTGLEAFGSPVEFSLSFSQFSHLLSPKLLLKEHHQYSLQCLLQCMELLPSKWLSQQGCTIDKRHTP